MSGRGCGHCDMGSKKPTRISWQTEYKKDKEDFKILEGLIKYVNRDPVWNTARGLDLKRMKIQDSLWGIFGLGVHYLSQKRY